ncbi:lytic polysaccharide monooxygenase [Stemphylium lycopersici]|uniref:Lytic polysaccharide monooxygenase n=1 Tax=Stemphylium lycopersici TaxID=183478 RepID=A0A364MVZ5_STELY|nr:hypothetical protein TW65_01258 [Stemphylium lycopersici]RAR00283.1 lytic polysaccharide monooxygenase [Stemphylium lycopersici]RAR05174.1 lytic polysaccharide monooxygenase [Stemphylium lycopersici]
MFTIFFTLLAAVTMLVMGPLSANAHMIMANPVPFNSPNNSPLMADGSDFPCKGPASGDAKVNEWKAGSEQSLSFTGTAVHGGGSCQISVTTDKNPTADSKWKVIYSIEGGCPASAEGNLDASGPSLDGAFPFTVPESLPNGELTVAWTWFNKIGNREMYMNCGAISISGGADDASGLDELPDMAVANVNTPSSCGTTKESNDYTFKNPGKAMTSIGEGPFVDLCSGEGSEPAPGGGSNDEGNNPPAPSSPSAPEPTTLMTVTASMPPYPTNTGGVFAPSGAAPTGGAKPSASPVAPQPSAPKPTSAPGGSEGTSCSTDGEIVCSDDGNKFGLCSFGKAVMMPVTTGTKCANGAIAKRAVYAHRNQRTAIDSFMW